jgi:hypothetical protein
MNQGARIVVHTKFVSDTPYRTDWSTVSLAYIPAHRVCAKDLEMLEALAREEFVEVDHVETFMDGDEVLFGSPEVARFVLLLNCVELRNHDRRLLAKYLGLTTREVRGLDGSWLPYMDYITRPDGRDAWVTNRHRIAHQDPESSVLTTICTASARAFNAHPEAPVFVLSCVWSGYGLDDSLQFIEFV